MTRLRAWKWFKVLVAVDILGSVVLWVGGYLAWRYGWFS